MDRVPYVEVMLSGGDIKRLPADAFEEVTLEWRHVRETNQRWMLYEGPHAYGGRTCFYYADILSIDLWDLDALKAYDAATCPDKEPWSP